MKKYIILYLFLVQSLICQTGPISPISSGYGSNGKFKIAHKQFSNPKSFLTKIDFYYPDTTLARRPTVFFCHGFGATDPGYYAGLITHIVSNGYNLVYSPYPVLTLTFKERYEILLNGFYETYRRNYPYMDSSKICIMGHSFGAGAIPYIAKNMVAKNWGSNSIALFFMAPWYALEVSQNDLENIPPNTKMIMQVFDEDNSNDHRMAIDLYKNMKIPDSEKDYIIVNSGFVGGYGYYAGHLAPLTTNLQDKEDALDYYSIYRLFDAFADYSFNNNESAKQIALGNGSNQQIFMGKSGSGEELKKLTVTDTPVAYRDLIYYTWDWENPINQRKNITSVDLINKMPDNFILSQNYPNPFNPSTRIEYSLPVNSFVMLKVFDSLGREIGTLVNEQKTAGQHSAFFTLSSSLASSGTYFYQMKAFNSSGEGFIETKKMIYMK